MHYSFSSGTITCQYVPYLLYLEADLGPSDYPSFYTRLYTFLDRDLLHNKHRARFFRLTELFLSST
jgi:hypothetical protein